MLFNPHAPPPPAVPTSGNWSSVVHGKLFVQMVCSGGRLKKAVHIVAMPTKFCIAYKTIYLK